MHDEYSGAKLAIRWGFCMHTVHKSLSFSPFICHSWASCQLGNLACRKTPLGTLPPFPSHPESSEACYHQHPLLVVRALGQPERASHRPTTLQPVLALGKFHHFYPQRRHPGTCEGGDGSEHGGLFDRQLSRPL
jgi:hypothetical protein